jgi:hypothetical protein
MDHVVDLAAGRLGRPPDQAEEPLVRVGLAEQVDRLVGEDVTGEVAAVRLGQVVPEAREDDAVQAPILRRSKTTRVGTDIACAPLKVRGGAAGPGGPAGLQNR